MFLDYFAHRSISLLTKEFHGIEVYLATLWPFVALIIRRKKPCLNPISFPERDAASGLKRLKGNGIESPKLAPFVHSSYAYSLRVPAAILWNCPTQNKYLFG